MTRTRRRATVSVVRAQRLRSIVIPGAVAVAGLIGLAGCGSSSSSVTAGNGSPAAATTGFLTAISSNHGSQACGYVVPSQASVCTSAFSSGGGTVSAKNLHMGATTISGDRALVTALGTLCSKASGSAQQCFTSSNEKGGQPSGKTTFNQAYTSVEAGTSSANDPAIPCMMQNGKWYVDLGQTSSGSSSGG